MENDKPRPSRKSKMPGLFRGESRREVLARPNWPPRSSDMSLEGRQMPGYSPDYSPLVTFQDTSSRKSIMPIRKHLYPISPTFQGESSREVLPGSMQTRPNWPPRSRSRSEPRIQPSEDSQLVAMPRRSSY